mgnify:CR=1 FL=1
MNIGEKIKQTRIEKNFSIEELATIINDSVLNVEKYESNEIEPTLDKKLSLCNALDLKLDDLSFNISVTKNETYVIKDNENTEDRVNEQNEEIEEEYVSELPFATATTTYSEEVFDAVFKKEYKRYTIQLLISLIGYILITGYTFLIKINIFTYVGLAVTAYTFLKFILSFRNYRMNKINWTEQYGNIVKIYSFYN